MRARWRVDLSLCCSTHSTKAQWALDCSQRGGSELCKQVYRSTSSNQTRYNRYRDCIYSLDESVAEGES